MIKFWKRFRERQRLRGELQHHSNMGLRALSEARRHEYTGHTETSKFYWDMVFEEQQKCKELEEKIANI